MPYFLCRRPLRMPKILFHIQKVDFKRHFQCIIYIALQASPQLTYQLFFCILYCIQHDEHLKPDQLTEIYGMVSSLDVT